MTYSEVIETLGIIFGYDEEHVEKILQKKLHEKGINKTPEQYYEDAKNGKI